MSTKWGIAGAGKISNDFVAAVRSMNSNEHEFIAVASRQLSSAEAFASNHSIPKSYGSYEELAKDSNVEVVYVGNITYMHFAVGKLMLENGKHVLMEKPMTMNLKQTRALNEIARKNKRFLMEALWSRFLPSYNCLMDLIKRGTIGDVVHVDANLGVAMTDRKRIFSKAFGAGVILDVGIYPLNAVTMIYNGETPEKIDVVGTLSDDGVDMSMTSTLQYSNNRTATIATSGIENLANHLVISGTKGQIKVPNEMYAATKIETPTEVFEFPVPDHGFPTNYPNSGHLKYEAMEVRKCLIKGLLESSIMPLKDSEMLAEIMDEMRLQVGVVFPAEDED